jgi:4-diphosphocytidyl-2-C-methyl-D-erythritol kinase
VGLATAEVYAACTPNPVFEAVRGDLIRGVHVARDAQGVAALVANDLEPAALSLRPELAEVVAELRARGALAAAVSGSGPTVFAVVAGPAEAERLASHVPGALPVSPLV